MKKSAKLITLLLFGILLNLNSALYAEKIKDVEFNIYNSSTSIAASDITNALSGYSDGCTLDLVFISNDEFEITNVSCTSDDGTGQIEDTESMLSFSNQSYEDDQQEWFEDSFTGRFQLAEYILLLKRQGFTNFELEFRGGMIILTY